MKYPIRYQVGHGPIEKTEIRNILRRIPKITFSFNIESLKSDILKINEYDSQLIENKYHLLLSELESEIGSMIDRVRRLNEIKTNIEGIISLKASKITGEVVAKTRELEREFNEIYLIVQNDEIKFNNLRLPINEILSVHGSSIDDFYLACSEFGDMQLGNKVHSPSRKSSGSDDDFDFM